MKQSFLEFIAFFFCDMAYLIWFMLVESFGKLCVCAFLRLTKNLDEVKAICLHANVTDCVTKLEEILFDVFRQARVD